MEHSRFALAGAVLVVAVAAAAGYALGDRDEPARGEATLKSIASGPFALRAPANWRETRDPIRVPGLVLEDRVALSPPNSARSALIVGVAPADDGSLLSPQLRQRAGLVAPTGAVRLGGLEALHYGQFPGLGASGPVDLYASPVRDGALTAVCVGGDGGFRRSCQAAVATLRLTRGERYTLGADARLRQAVDRALLVLNTKRALGAAAMQRSRELSAQSSAANSVARAFRAAAAQVAAASHNPASSSPRGGVVRALHGAGAAWRRLARAADDGSVERYEAARLFVRSSESWFSALTRSVVAPGVSLVSTSPLPSPTRTAPPARTAMPAASPSSSTACSATHTQHGAIDVTGRGLVRVCVSRDGASLLVTNISHLVVAVRHDGRPTPVPDVANGLSAQAVRSVAPISCAASSCALPPGGAVRLDGTTAAPTFAPVVEDSVSAVIAAGLAGELESRLTPHPRRRPQQFAGCAEGVKKTIESRNREEIALNTIIEGQGCKKLITDILGTEDPVKRQSFARGVAKRVHGFSGGALEESFLVAVKAGLRVLRR